MFARAELYFHADLCVPFTLCLPDDERLIRFHCVLQGACYITLPGEEPELLEIGELVLEVHPTIDGKISIGDGEADTHLLFGYLNFDQTNEHPIWSILPNVVVLHAGDPHCGLALQLLFDEAKLTNHGEIFVLHRIVEIILIQFLRNAVVMDTGNYSFTASLRGPKLALCLQAIHTDHNNNEH